GMGRRGPDGGGPNRGKGKEREDGEEGGRGREVSLRGTRLPARSLAPALARLPRAQRRRDSGGPPQDQRGWARGRGRRGRRGGAGASQRGAVRFGAGNVGRRCVPPPPPAGRR